MQPVFTFGLYGRVGFFDDVVVRPPIAESDVDEANASCGSHL
jgi:hypothetical protein